ncbi:MAG: DivIVA domain-containing protein [Candidatus Hydrogenedentes bacterium]|nr:DivIVA domain-containing protein [Candidatus Hydrogenedentota bacterium]
MKKEKIIQEVFGGEAALTPSDLLSKEFKRAAVGGYNTNDVDEFLEHVADAFEKLIQQVRALKEESEEQRERLEEYRQMEASLRNALVSSQKFGEDVIEAAKREANLLLEEARMKRAQAHLEASKIPLALSQDILLLQQQRNRLRVEMTAILETHRNLLDSLIPQDAAKRPASLFEVGPPSPSLDTAGFEDLSSLQEETPRPPEPSMDESPNDTHGEVSASHDTDAVAVDAEGKV